MSEGVLNNVRCNPNNIPVKQNMFKEFLKYQYLEYQKNLKLNLAKQTTIPYLQGNSTCTICNTRKQCKFSPIIHVPQQKSTMQSNRHPEIIQSPLITRLYNAKFPQARTYFTSFQLDELKKEFENNNFLDRAQRAHLAQYLNLTEEQVEIWFRNKRAKLERNENKQSYSHSNKNCASSTYITQDLNALNVCPKIEEADSKQSTYGVLNHSVQQQCLPSDPSGHTNITHDRQWRGNAKMIYSPINPKLSKVKSRKGTRFTRFQRAALNKEFENDNYMKNERKAQLAQFVKLTEKQVKIWFSNKRATLKTMCGKKNLPLLK